MHYEVRYHSEKNHSYPVQTGKSIKFYYVILGLLLAAFLIKPCIPQIKTIVHQYQKTYDFRMITQHLQQGENLEEALTAFCLNVLQHGAVS